MEPVRAVGSGLASKVNGTMAAPVPLVLARCSQAAFTVALQGAWAVNGRKAISTELAAAALPRVRAAAGKVSWPT